MVEVLSVGLGDGRLGMLWCCRLGECSVIVGPRFRAIRVRCREEAWPPCEPIGDYLDDPAEDSAFSVDATQALAKRPSRTSPFSLARHQRPDTTSRAVSQPPPWQ